MQNILALQVARLHREVPGQHPEDQLPGHPGGQGDARSVEFRAFRRPVGGFSAGRPVGRSAVGSWSSHTVARTLVQACSPHVWVDQELFGGIRFAVGVSCVSLTSMDWHLYFREYVYSQSVRTRHACVSIRPACVIPGRLMVIVLLGVLLH